MNIQAEKIELAKMLFDTDNESIIERIKAVFEEYRSEWKGLNNAEIQSIEAGLKEIEASKTISHDELMKKGRHLIFQSSK